MKVFLNSKAILLLAFQALVIIGVPKASHAAIPMKACSALFERWGAMAPALWVLAVLSTITVIHRIRYTYTQTELMKLDQAAS